MTIIKSVGNLEDLGPGRIDNYVSGTEITT